MNRRKWIIAFFTAVVFIAAKGYYFNSSDQEEHLPQVYQLINPALYHHDYFINAYHQTFSVRFYYVWLIYLAHFIVAVSGACFLFHVLCITISAFALREMAFHLGLEKTAAHLFPLLMLVVFNSWTVGGNAFIDPQLTSGSFAACFCSLAFLMIVKGKWKTAAVLLGCASLFQLLGGLQLFIISSVVLWFETEQKNKLLKLFQFTVCFLLVASPMLVPILSQQVKHVSAYESRLFYHILYHIRNPNHYLPGAFPMIDYIKFISLTIVAGVVVFFVDQKNYSISSHPKGSIAGRLINAEDSTMLSLGWGLRWKQFNTLKKLWLLFFTLIIGGMIVYSLLLEAFGINTIGKTQWFKTASWLTMMNVLVITDAAFIYVINSNLHKLIPRISSLLVLALCVIGIIIICNSRYIPVKRFQYRYHIGNYPLTDLAKMHEWISKNTPVDFTILPEPTDDSFLCEAQRSTPAGWKAIIHEPFFLIPWYEKMMHAYHHNKPFECCDALQQADDDYNNHPPLTAVQLHWDYRIADLSKGVMLNTEKIIHRENDVVLLQQQ